ncbi:hypothetical protein ABIA00_003106 [Bradyrhizobium ottawaense]
MSVNKRSAWELNSPRKALNEREKVAIWRAGGGEKRCKIKGFG